MKRFVHAAEEPEITIEDMFKDTIAVLKDNFDFAIAGIEKIAADGDIQGALEQARTLNEMIDGSIGEIAEDIAE